MKSGDWVVRDRISNDRKWPHKQRRVQIESVDDGHVVIGGHKWNPANFKIVKGPIVATTSLCKCGCGESVTIKYKKRGYLGFKRGHFRGLTPAGVPRTKVAQEPLTGPQLALVLSHLEYAEGGAKKHFKMSGGKTDYDELRSAAYLGLVEAAVRYSADRNVKFTTYSFHWIEKELRDVWRARAKADGFGWATKNGKQVFIRKALIIQWPTNSEGESVDYRDMPDRRLG